MSAWKKLDLQKGGRWKKGIHDDVFKGAGGGAAGGLLCRESSGKLLPLQSCPSVSSSKSAPVLIDLLMAVFNGWKAAGTSGFYYWPIKT